MKEKIYIGVAWPYANGSLHLGHMAGCYLPADIFARFHRLIGNDVLMDSGSDEHGTPVTITADKEKTTPQKIVDRYNQEHTQNMKDFGISFDLFTRTTTDNHTEVVQDIFSTLYNKGYIYKKEIESFYCHQCKRFLPDRYIEGTCPDCANESARGDQCDECGHLLDPEDLVEVRCKICGETPELQTTEHFFFALSKFEEKLLQWLEDKTYWKSSVLNFTQNWLKDGLHDRAITRDMSWGIPVPIEGYEEKRIYVWFDAVIGYLSASIEWSKKHQGNLSWEDWWKNPNAKHYYFLAKDNIPFHSIIWPSIIMGYDETLQLPYDIPANEYLRLEGEQFSKSKGLGIWVPAVLEQFDVDAIRYYLSINMPENRDSNWDWQDFLIKNNDELVGTYGNFIHRVISFTQKNFSSIPPQGILNEMDEKLIKEIAHSIDIIKNSLLDCKFKQGLKEAMSLAKKGNVYFNEKQPWQTIKTNQELCKTTLHVCLQIAQALAVVLASYLPFSSEKVWKMLGHTESVHETPWDQALQPLPVGFELAKPKLLFKKLALEDIMEEKDIFSKFDIRVAQILEVKDHPNADKLYLLHIDVGDLGKRIIVAGLKDHYTAEELQGKKIALIANLETATIRGIRSNGMLLAAEDKTGTVSLLDPKDAERGEIVQVKGIESHPDTQVPFAVFQQLNIRINSDGHAVYKEKVLQTSKGAILTDKPVQEHAEVH